MIHGTLCFRSLHPIPSSDWALLGYGLSPLYLAHVFLPCRLAIALAMPLHSSCYNITYLFALLLLLGLWAEPFAMSISYIIPSFGLTTQHSRWANPFRTLGFLGPFHSLGVAHFILPYFFHAHGFFAKSFGLPRPNYHILTFRAYWHLSQPHEFTNSFLWASPALFLLSFHLLQFLWVYYFIH